MLASSQGKQPVEVNSPAASRLARKAFRMILPRASTRKHERGTLDSLKVIDRLHDLAEICEIGFQHCTASSKND